MKKILYVALPIAMLFTMNSCDWFNVTFLGKPSKAEQELERLINLEKVRQDSLALAVVNLETQAQQQKEEQPILNPINVTEGARYQIIVGCFKVAENADAMIKLLQKNGYAHSRKLFLKNGFTCISAVTSNDINTAYREMYKILKLDFCPEDAWIYDTETGLHK